MYSPDLRVMWVSPASVRYIPNPMPTTATYILFARRFLHFKALQLQEASDRQEGWTSPASDEMVVRVDHLSSWIRKWVPYKLLAILRGVIDR